MPHQISFLRQAKVFLKKVLFHFGFRKSESFLANISGLIHIGGNTGQDRDHYAQYSLKVIWVEPVPEVFSILEQNLNGYDEQLAVKACVSEFDDERVVFKVSNNNGASSSMFNFKLHKVAFPEVQYIDEFPTTTISLPTLLKKLNLEIVDFQAIVIDAQGAELQILRGAGDLLKKVKYVKVEVADYEAYEGGCTNSEIIDFLLSNKFRILSKDLIARNDCIGNYYDYVFKNDSTSQSLRFKT